MSKAGTFSEQVTIENTRIAGRLSLKMTRCLFTNLLQQMNANPWVLGLVGNKYDGFHHMKFSKNGYADTYFFGVFRSTSSGRCAPRQLARWFC